MGVQLKFEPRDIWIGVYWDRPMVSILSSARPKVHLYICLIPMWPLHIWWERRRP